MKDYAKSFIEKLNLKYGNKYTCNQADYINNYTPIQFKCSIHGIFNNQPYKVLESIPCPGCKLDRLSNLLLTKEINKIKRVEKTKLSILISQLKSDIKLYNLKLKEQSRLDKTTLEIKLYKFISSHFNTIAQGRPAWLGNQRFDIYLPDYNIAIEYQGIQHFKPIDYFGGEQGFLNTQKRDERKLNLSLLNNCILLYFTYNPKDIPADYKHNVYTNEQKLYSVISTLIKDKSIFTE